ncbi:MAG: S8 family serine peptidase, partial [Prolixibacteraceae bacterium]|nr:S8 family serine peptidase [Prolixibacteraceae bacterium]
MLLLLIIPFINSCKDDDSFENVTTETQETVTEETNKDSYTTGKIRVKFTEELALQVQTTIKLSKNSNTTTKTEVKSVDNALSSLNVTGLKRTLPYCGKFEKRTHEAGLDRWYDITFDKSKSLTKANNDLSLIDGIDIVEYIPIVKISDNTKNTVPPSTATKNYSNIVTNKNNDIYPFNDPYSVYQWNYYNDGVDYNGDPDSNMVKGCDINVLSVWKNFTTGNKDVIVAVIDEGIDINHEDLAGNIWENSSELNGITGVDDDNNGYVDDINGYNFVKDKGNIVGDDHGTHVAGTIGAVNNNGIGVCGIAGGDKGKDIKGVSLMSCEIFENYTDDNGDTSTSQGKPMEAIKYAADNGAVIAQCSWGYTDPTSNYIGPYYEKVIDYFIKYAGIDENGIQTGPMEGGVIIFSAGNDDNIYGPPGSYEPA